MFASVYFFFNELYLCFMIKIFKNNIVISYLFLILLIASYHLLNFQFKIYSYQSYIDLGLWGRFLNVSNISIFLSGFVLFCNAFLFNYIFNKNEFIEKNTYVSGLLYVVFMSFFHSFFAIDGLLISHFFMLLMLLQIYRLHQNMDARKIIFNTSFLAGMASTFHPPLVVLLPFFWFMIWVLRPFVIREIVLSILGFASPLIYGAVYQYYFQHTIALKLLDQYVNYAQNQLDFLITSVLFLLLFLLSLWSLSAKMSKSSIRLKKLIRVQWWLMLLCVGIGLYDFIFFQQIERFSFILLPLSFFASFAFYHKTYENIGKILFYLSFIYSFVKFFL